MQEKEYKDVQVYLNMLDTVKNQVANEIITILKHDCKNYFELENSCKNFERHFRFSTPGFENSEIAVLIRKLIEQERSSLPIASRRSNV